MSGYYDDDTPRRRSHRTSRRPVYEEEVIETRGPRANRTTDLIRRRDSDEDVEEVRRDFAPGEGAYVSRKYSARERRAPARARSVGRSSYYSDDDYEDSRRGGGRRRDRESNQALVLGQTHF